jgi:helix-turn-helix protein
MKSTTNTKQSRKAAKHKFDLLKRLIADVVLSPAAKVVAAVLLLQFHNTKTGQCNPSFATIGERSGRSRSSIIRDVAELEQTGWIAVVSTKGGSSSNTNQFKFDFARMSSRPSAESAPIQPDCANKRSDDASADTSQAFDNADNSTTPPVSPVTPLPVSALPPVADIELGVSPLEHEPLRTNTKREREILPFSALASLALEEREEKFQQLYQIWFRPYGTNKAKARDAYVAVCAEHGPEISAQYGGDIADLLLVSARNWTAKKAPRWLPKLEDWLVNEAWRNEPSPDKDGNTRGGDNNMVAEMLRQGVAQ